MKVGLTTGHGAVSYQRISTYCISSETMYPVYPLFLRSSCVLVIRKKATKASVSVPKARLVL